jgi:hypothetical protein
MGRMKELQIEQWEAGFSAPWGQSVCGSCTGDQALSSLVEEHANADECSFCGRKEQNIAADTDTVLERIGSQLLIGWSRAEDILYHDPEEESGYAGPVYEIRDVLESEGVEFGNEDFEAFVLEAFGATQYTPEGVYAMTEGEALRAGWDDLVETVKHRQRFFFVLARNDRSGDGAGVAVPRGRELLSELDRLIREYGLLRELSAETPLYRVRLHRLRKRYETAKDLGAPPPGSASQSRMSPAGIPMLYTAEEIETAIAETVGTRDSRRKGLTIATFKPTETLRIVDFSQLPSIPSIFDASAETPRVRHELGFLHGMRRDIGGEVVLDGRQHIEYVPTQVVCEYVRHRLPERLGGPVHGLAWESTRAAGGRNVVLFFDRDRCVETGERPRFPSGPLAELAEHQRRRLP